MSQTRSDSAEARKQVLEMFGSLLEDDEFVENSPPKKQRRDQEDVEMHHGSSSSRQQQQHPKQQQQFRPRSRERAAPSMNSLTMSMARLLIRHEDALATLKQNSAFMMFVDTTSALLPLLFRASKRWKERKEDVLRLEVPLRCALLTCVFQDLLRRATRVQQLLQCGPQQSDFIKAQEELKQFVDNKVIDGNNFLTKAWNGKELAVVQGTLAVDEACHMLQRLAAVISDPEVIQKFNSVRPLAPHYQSKTLPFFLELGWRHRESATIWEDMNVLTKFSVLQLVGAQLKRTTLRRSPLAQEIREQLSTLSRRT